MIPLGIDGVSAHILGPPRDLDLLRKMDPPKQVAWLRVGPESPGPVAASGVTGGALFGTDFVVTDQLSLPLGLLQARGRLKLSLDWDLLSAASLLERVVNNTSLFFVLDVQGTRLVFPGDAQHGAWEHVLNDERAGALLADAAFYKIGHHGSHNATPKPFIESVWRDGGYAMLPWGLVERWRLTIPKQEILDSLARHHHTLIRADETEEAVGDVRVDPTWSSEITLPLTGGGQAEVGVDPAQARKA